MFTNESYTTNLSFKFYYRLQRYVFTFIGGELKVEVALILKLKYIVNINKNYNKKNCLLF